MKYQVEFSEKAKQKLKKLDIFTQKMILKWIQKNLIQTENPKLYGKELKGNLKSIWCYRVGNYRILVDIQDSTLVILILKIGHRREFYKK